jgi:hypothetical protein
MTGTRLPRAGSGAPPRSGTIRSTMRGEPWPAIVLGAEQESLAPWPLHLGGLGSEPIELDAGRRLDHIRRLPSRPHLGFGAPGPPGDQFELSTAV